MMRNFVKTGAACLFAWTGASHLLRAAAGLRRLPVVFGYHRVVERFHPGEAAGMPAMQVSARMLEHQLDWIAGHYRIIGLDELGAYLDQGQSPPDSTAAITFDDGYLDFYTTAFPLLRRKGIPAAVFVVTDLVGKPDPFSHDRLFHLLSAAFASWPDVRLRLLDAVAGVPSSVQRQAGMHVQSARDAFHASRLLLDLLSRADLDLVLEHLEERFHYRIRPPEALRSMDWEMLREISKAGIVVGSHTRSHPCLTREKPHVVFEEVEGSRHELESRLGSRIQHFAYPAGRFDAGVVAAVAEAGYRFGYSTCLHRHSGHPLLSIPRKVLWENSCLDALGDFSPALMRCQAMWTFDLLAACPQQHGGETPATTAVLARAGGARPA